MKLESVKHEVERVIEKLENNAITEAGPVSEALIYLKRFAIVIDSVPSRPRDIRFLDGVYSELNQFWLNGVPWCSEISKDIEKIIIMYADARETAG